MPPLFLGMAKKAAIADAACRTKFTVVEGELSPTRLRYSGARVRSTGALQAAKEWPGKRPDCSGWHRLRRRKRPRQLPRPAMVASTQACNGIGEPASRASRRKNRRVIASIIVDHCNVSIADDRLALNPMKCHQLMCIVRATARRRYIEITKKRNHISWPTTERSLTMQSRTTDSIPVLASRNKK
jgi:hypothetical protein